VRRKLAGYRAAMTRLVGSTESELDDLTSLSFFGVEGGEAAAGRLIDRGVTGLVCGSDLMALGAIRAGRQRGLSVPGDLSVVGYDDSPLIAFTDPPLTTVRQPVRAMAVAAVRALVDEINGHAAPHSAPNWWSVARPGSHPSPATSPERCQRRGHNRPFLAQDLLDSFRPVPASFCLTRDRLTYDHARS
jgi:hypothetical protein